MPIGSLGLFLHVKIPAKAVYIEVTNMILEEKWNGDGTV